MPTTYKEKKNKGIKITRPSNVKQEQWDKAMNLYQVAKERGDKYPELTVAQAALETGWFKSPSGRFNYFGQKASKSQEGSYKNTQEVANDQFYSTKAKFRDYNSLDKAVDDRIEKWGSKYANADTVEDALYSIWKYDPEKGSGVGYATDDKYDVKIKSILGMMGVPMSKTAAKVQKEQTPSYQTDVVEETEKTQESTAVAQDTDYERLYNQIEQQNNLLLQEREERIAKEEATTKAQQAQAKLDEKLKQRKFLEDLIMQTGVEYVERAPRESVYDQPQQQIFQDGGEQKPSPELEKYIEDLNSYRPLNSEETANTVRNVGYNLYSYFGGKKDEQLEESPYKPSVNGDENKKYFYRKGMREDVYRDLTSEKVKKDYNHSGEFSDIHKALKANGEDREHNANESFSKNKVGYKGMYNLGSPQSVNTAQFNLGRYTVDAGEDDRGRYISFNDTYDWNGFQKGEPIPFYDRIYEEEWETYKNKK